MKTWRINVCAAALAILAGALADGALAQRGERGGERGDGGGGRSFSGGRSAPGGGGGGQTRSRSAAPGQNLKREAEQSRPADRQPRTFSGRQNTQRNFPQGQSQRGPGNVDRSAFPQRSFYRGPDGGQLESRRADRVESQSSQEFGRVEFNRQQSNRPDRNPRSGDRDGRGQFRSDRFYDEMEQRSRFDDRGLGDRDRDRDRWDGARDRDRSEWYLDSDRDNARGWNRYGRDDWGWRRDDIRRNWWRGFAGAAVPFRYGWWDNYYGSSWPIYSPWRYSRWQNRPYFWWGNTPAARLTDWFVFGWDRPRYWAYGPGANIYYRDNYVYYDNQRTVPVNDYYQQVYDLAHSVPNITEAEAEKMDWAPLGVFAALRQGETESQRAMQIAVNRDGVLTGTYMNRSNGHVHPVSGMVDERTQRAAWVFADGQHEQVVFETGIYNLTRDEASMMVHFGPSADDTEVWQLVRLEQPESGEPAATTPRSATSQALP